MSRTPILNRNINLIHNYCKLKGLSLKEQESVEEHLRLIEKGSPYGCHEVLIGLSKVLPNAGSLLASELGYSSASLFLHRYEIEPFVSSTVILAIYIGMARGIYESEQ